MAASDYASIFFKNRLHLVGRPQMSTRPKLRLTLLRVQASIHYPDVPVTWPRGSSLSHR